MRVTAFEIHIPSQFFDYRQFMCLDKFDGCTVGVGNIGKSACSFSHIERLGTINGKRKTFGLHFGFEPIDADGVETEVNKSRVAPDTIFKELFPLFINELNKLYARWSKKRSKTSVPRLAVLQKHTAHFCIAAGQCLQIIKHSGFIVNNLIIFQNILIHF